MNLGILFALLTMLGFGLNSAFSKRPTDYYGPSKAILLRNITVVLILLPIVVVVFTKVEFNFLGILMGIGWGVIGYIPILYFMKGLEKGKLGVVVPISKTKVIWTIFFAMIILKEFISLTQGALIFLIMVGVILLTKKQGQAIISSDTLKHGAFEALVAAFLWAIWFVVYKLVVSSIGIFPAAFTVELGVLIGAVSHVLFRMKFKKEKLVHENKKVYGKGDRKSIIFELIAAGLFTAVGTTSFAFSISYIPVSLASAIVAANPIIALSYGHIRLHERFSKQEGIGILIIVIGIVAISLV